MSPEAYATLPRSIVVRELRYQVVAPGCRTREVTLVTTLLDATCYPADELAELYAQRWQIEVYQPECPSSAHLYQRAA